MLLFSLTPLLGVGIGLISSRQEPGRLLRLGDVYPQRSVQRRHLQELDINVCFIYSGRETGVIRKAANKYNLL